MEILAVSQGFAESFFGGIKSGGLSEPEGTVCIGSWAAYWPGAYGHI